MNELEIIKLENTDISGWNFSAIREELQSRLNFYANMVYTDDTLKDAKKDRTTLNKAKKVIEDARKAYKARCLAPYEALELDVKALVDMIEKQRALIDETVKEYETREKEAKERVIKKVYDRKAVVLGALAERLYPVIFDSKWLNASYQKSKYEEEMILAITSAATDLEAIRAWKSPFVDTLIELYCQTCSLERVKEKKIELEEATKKASLTTNIATPAVADHYEPHLEDSKKGSVLSTEGIVLRIVATQNQFNQITDFMKAIGVHYELV